MASLHTNLFSNEITDLSEPPPTQLTLLFGIIKILLKYPHNHYLQL